MAKTKKTAAEKVATFLAGRKRPVTAADIATRTGLTATTVRETLKSMNGQVKTAGRIYGGVGRPPQTYLPA